MSKHTKTLFIALMLMISAQTVTAQETVNLFKDSFLGKFNYAAQRLVDLAEAMPADKFSWSPGEGVMSVERVYMHISHYNYAYPESSLKIKAPDDLDLETMEEITGKEAVVAHLKRSMDHVRNLVHNMSEADLKKAAELYGRNTQAWDVLFQLITHMSEHTGQAISYARFNGIVPPWSQ